MDKRRVSRSRSRHFQLIDEPLPPSDYSEKHCTLGSSRLRSNDPKDQDQTAHCLDQHHHHHHHHRNNHNCGSIQYDEVASIAYDHPQQRSGIRPTTAFADRLYQKSSLISIYLSNFLLLLIRFMLLLLLLLICAIIVYHLLNYLYPKPKYYGWERVWYSFWDWFVGE